MKVSAQSSDGSKINTTLFLAHRSHKRSIPEYFFFVSDSSFYLGKTHLFHDFWTSYDAHILFVKLK